MENKKTVITIRMPNGKVETIHCEAAVISTIIGQNEDNIQSGVLMCGNMNPKHTFFFMEKILPNAIEKMQEHMASFNPMQMIGELFTSLKDILGGNGKSPCEECEEDCDEEADDEDDVSGIYVGRVKSVADLKKIMEGLFDK